MYFIYSGVIYNLQILCVQNVYVSTSDDQGIRLRVVRLSAHLSISINHVSTI